MKGNSTSQSSWCSSASAGDLREELFDKVLFHWHHKYKTLTPVDKVFPVHSALSLPCLLIAVVCTSCFLCSTWQGYIYQNILKQLYLLLPTPMLKVFLNFFFTLKCRSPVLANMDKCFVIEKNLPSQATQQAAVSSLECMEEPSRPGHKQQTLREMWMDGQGPAGMLLLNPAHGS